MIKNAELIIQFCVCCTLYSGFSIELHLFTFDIILQCTRAVGLVKKISYLTSKSASALLFSFMCPRVKLQCFSLGCCETYGTLTSIEIIKLLFHPLRKQQNKIQHCFQVKTRQSLPDLKTSMHMHDDGANQACVRRSSSKKWPTQTGICKALYVSPGGRESNFHMSQKLSLDAVFHLVPVT